MTEPTRGKGAKGPSWLADLTKLQEVGDAHTFRPPDTVFDYSTAERGSGATGRVVVRASVSKDKAQAKGLLVHIPHALAEKLRRKCLALRPSPCAGWPSGPWSN
jgi:hypothetical protein